MKQSMATLQARHYNLQPGDSVRYQFHITAFHRPAPHQLLCVESETGEITVPVPLYELVTGVGTWQEAEESFVMLGICMPGSQGSYEVRKSSLCDPRPHFIDYLKGKMPGVDPYTLAAVVLAAGVLVDRPNALVEAAEEMLRASELL